MHRAVFLRGPTATRNGMKFINKVLTTFARSSTASRFRRNNDFNQFPLRRIAGRYYTLLAESYYYVTFDLTCGKLTSSKELFVIELRFFPLLFCFLSRSSAFRGKNLSPASGRRVVGLTLKLGHHRQGRLGNVVAGHAI